MALPPMFCRKALPARTHLPLPLSRALVCSACQYGTHCPRTNNSIGRGFRSDGVFLIWLLTAPVSPVAPRATRRPSARCAEERGRGSRAHSAAVAKLEAGRRALRWHATPRAARSDGLFRRAVAAPRTAPICRPPQPARAQPAGNRDAHPGAVTGSRPRRPRTPRQGDGAPRIQEPRF